MLTLPPNDLRENSIVFGAKPETATVPPLQETGSSPQRLFHHLVQEPNLRDFNFHVEPYLLLGDVREQNKQKTLQKVLIFARV